MQRDLSERLMRYVFMFCALISIIAILLIFYFIFIGGSYSNGEWVFEGGIPFLMRHGLSDVLLNTVWRPNATNAQFGIFPFILGSIYVTIGAVAIGVPIGVLTAIFMAFFCPDKLYKWIKPGINLMAAIPSIVYGYFALKIFVPFFRDIFPGNGMHILTASVLLGVMILPTIIGLSEASLRAVPRSYYEASMGLGATHERSVINVVLPAAKSGILSAVVLGVGRAIGETMAVVLITGNQPRVPESMFDGARTLTTNIVLEMGYASGEHRLSLIATAAVLFVFIIIINSIFMFIKAKGDKY